jgi:hypothetical protein
MAKLTVAALTRIADELAKLRCLARLPDDGIAVYLIYTTDECAVEALPGIQMPIVVVPSGKFLPLPTSPQRRSTPIQGIDDALYIPATSLMDAPERPTSS